MRKNISYLSLLLFCTLLFNSCSIMGDSIKPSKNFITRDYKVHNFNQIDATTVGDIFYTQSTDGTTSVKIYGPDNIVNLVEVVVKGSTLEMTMKKYNQIKNSKLKINISSPELTGINFKGVGDIHIDDLLTTPELSVASKGVGDIHILNLNCDELTVNSMGVGDIKLEGVAQTANLSSKGVGDIEARELKATYVDASSKGVGDISCYATETLKASVKGVGSIQYKGNPAKKDFSKGGVGSIKND